MTQEIAIPQIRKSSFTLTIVGDTSLITHQFSDNEKQNMLEKQMKKAAKPRAPKDPQKQYEESIYRTVDGLPGFPVSGIKKASVSACRFLDMKMTEARGAFYIFGDSNDILPIEGQPRMREDIVRLNGRTADIRYRAEFMPWSITFKVLYNPSIITDEGIVNLINIAGFHIGIGDWRPEKDGIHGMFHVLEG